jgi:hypothetical protein
MLMAASACGGAETLSGEEMDKLSPALQRIVQGDEPPPLSDLVTGTRDGTTVYAVILRVSDADAVRDAGIPLNSVQGSVATARLSVDQIRDAARVPEVARVEESGRVRPMSS